MPLPNLVQTDGAGGEMSKARLLESLEGEWVGTWGGATNEHEWHIAGGEIVQIDNEGQEVEKTIPITYKNGDLFLLGYGPKSFHIGFSPIRYRGGSLLYLGWPAKGRKPESVFTDPPVMVGILEKK